MRLPLLSTTALSGLLLGLPAFAPAWAQETSVSEVIITATRLPAEAKDVPGVHVIDRADIEARQATFASDILETIPGVSLSRNGAFGGVTGVRLRGASVDKTLVLIDGIPQNDPSSPSGGYDFGSLQLADIERIEVLAGPQGSLWGSDAIGGVIALTSREIDGWRAGLEGGHYSTLNGSAAVGRASDAYAVSASASGYRTDGVSKAAVGTEDDGLRSWTAGLSGRVKVSDAVTLDGRLRYNDAKIDIDGYGISYAFGDTPEYATSKSWSGLARAKVKGLLGLDHEFSLSAYDLSRKSLGGFYPSGYGATRQVFRWIASHGDVNDPVSYLFGAEHESAKADLSYGAKLDQDADSVFGVVRLKPAERLTATASLRYDDPAAYKGRATARISAAYEVTPGLTVSAAFGQGFKTPTISQSACDFCYTPAVALKAERADGYDLGAVWRAPDGRIEVGLTGYRLQVREQISYSSGHYINISRTRTDGIETDVTVALTERLKVKAAYAWTDAVDRSTGRRLLRVPEHQGSATLLWTGAALSGALTVRAEGDQADSDPSTFLWAVRDGFIVADVTGGWRLNDRVEFTARIENLTDESYQQSVGYGETGRAVYLGVRLKN